MVEKKSPKKDTKAPAKQTTKRAVVKKDEQAQSYAIFKHGGKQYQAVVGKTLALEKITGESGDSVSFDTVLLKKSDDQVQIGTPCVTGATVTASIVKHDKAPKVIIFHFKRRKKSRVKRGHRQPLTVVRIESI